MNPNLSTSFRTALKDELPQWVQEGIVPEATAQRLSARYQLDEIRKESSRLLAAVIFTLGILWKRAATDHENLQSLPCQGPPLSPWHTAQQKSPGWLLRKSP